jgi:hypothetical protein
MSPAAMYSFAARTMRSYSAGLVLEPGCTVSEPALPTLAE